jgi:hypothetical protein
MPFVKLKKYEVFLNDGLVPDSKPHFLIKSRAGAAAVTMVGFLSDTIFYLHCLKDENFSHL